LSHPTDVAIIGGGIIGLATAYELSRQGVRATVLEGETAGAGQSGRNWGFVRQQGRSPQELPMMCAANRRWRQLEDEIGERFDWVQGGNLALSGADSATRYQDWAELGRNHGLDTRLVGTDEVRELVPGLSFPHQVAIECSASSGTATG
jgi:glycine/D-amino acid oxidase-like deaminating enzyme